MRKFQITVNGNSYEVEVEELTSENLESPVMKKEKAVHKQPVADAPIKVSSVGTDKITAPMPGKIVKVGVKEGDNIKEGDLIAVLEAMKMENEIFAPSDGKVVSVHVTTGAMVETNDAIITFN